MRRLMLLLSIFAVLGFLMTGCKKEKKPAADEPTTEEPTTEEPTTEEPTTEEPKEEPAAATEEGGGEKIGIPECDDYLDKYTSCLKDKVPAASRAMMEKSLNTTREAWRKAAATEAGKAGLAQACKTASAAAAKAMKAFGCEW